MRFGKTVQKKKQQSKHGALFHFYYFPLKVTLELMGDKVGPVGTAVN